MVVSGAPEKEGNHAERVCDMALDMVDAITNLKDPSTGNNYNNKIQFKFLIILLLYFISCLSDYTWKTSRNLFSRASSAWSSINFI